MADLDLLDHLEREVSVVNQDNLDNKETEDQQDLLVNAEVRDHLVPLGQLEVLVYEALLESQERVEREDQLDHQVH